MAYKVRCAITGEYGTSDTFIKIDGKYYKNQDVYNEQQKQNDYWHKIVDKFSLDYLGYQKGQLFPAYIVKMLKQLSFYGNDTIYRTMEFCDNDIHTAIQIKDFDSDYRKASYIMAIVKNNINEVWKEVLQERREAKKAKQMQNSVPIEISNPEEISNPKQNVKDISKFLED